MKIKSLLIGMLAAVVAVSCSKKEESDNQPKGEKTWVALSIGSAKTYAEDDGTAEESKINTVDIFLFTPNQGDVNASALEAKYHFDVSDITGSKTPAFETNTASKKMVVLVNAPSSFVSQITSTQNLTLGSLIDGANKLVSSTSEANFTTDYANPSSSGNFMMVSENPTADVFFTLMPDPTSAVSYARTINVERLVAKIVAKVDASVSGAFASSIKQVDFIVDVRNKASLLFPTNGQDHNYSNAVQYNAGDFFTEDPSSLNSNFTGATLTSVPTSGDTFSNPAYAFANTIEQDYNNQSTKYAKEHAATNLIFRVKLRDSDFWLSKIDGTIADTDPNPNSSSYIKYNGGYCYYRVFIKTDDAIPGGTNELAYGVKRNNMYKVTINKIEQVGSPSIQALLDQPIATNKLIGVDISVKKWTVVQNDVVW